MDNQTRIDGLLTLLWNWELGAAILLERYSTIAGRGRDVDGDEEGRQRGPGAARGGAGTRTAKPRRRGGSWPARDERGRDRAAARAERRGGRRGRGAGAAGDARTTSRIRGGRGRCRVGAAGDETPAQHARGTRGRWGVRHRGAGGRRDARQSSRGEGRRGPTRGRGWRWRRRRRASAGAGAHPDDVDLKLVRCRREGRGIVGCGGKVSAGWTYQPALMCPRWRQQYRLVPAGKTSRY